MVDPMKKTNNVSTQIFFFCLGLCSLFVVTGVLIWVVSTREKSVFSHSLGLLPDGRDVFLSFTGPIAYRLVVWSPAGK